MMDEGVFQALTARPLHLSLAIATLLPQFCDAGRAVRSPIA